MSDVAIETRALRKVYVSPQGKRGAPKRPDVVALAGLDLTVSEGEFFGLLGPNGAGKTTTIGILTTRVYATSGDAFVAGISVTNDPAGVKRRIGVVPQRPNADRGLSVIENLVFHASYFGVPRADARRRGEELLERMGLAEKRDAKVDSLSGGQQQRLMIARALSHDPQVLFLDEPTVGLDPQARLSLWDILRDLHAHGRTIIMTTHYMEEADRLCDRLAIIDQGKLLALDTPAALSAKAPGETIIDITFDAAVDPLVPDAQRVDGVSHAEARGVMLRVYSGKAGEVIPGLLAAGETRGLTVRDIHLERPSLETLFISLTGRKLT
ncbi:MAG TPA: ABC transporter ATP-binding protein [Thermoanaerobaculia bacterium]